MAGMGRPVRGIPAELVADDLGHAWGNRLPAIRQDLGEPHPPGEDVIECQRKLVAGGPRNLGLELVDAGPERPDEIELTTETDDRGCLGPVSIDVRLVEQLYVQTRSQPLYAEWQPATDDWLRFSARLMEEVRRSGQTTIDELHYLLAFMRTPHSIWHIPKWINQSSRS